MSACCGRDRFLPKTEGLELEWVLRGHFAWRVRQLNLPPRVVVPS
ncbi:MAG: hypothetical protein VKN83_01905 [Cyanobacteriota bacterium]|nr:hypothetical protein [Cyanobacteriota bacterium]